MGRDHKINKTDLKQVTSSTCVKARQCQHGTTMETSPNPLQELSMLGYFSKVSVH